MNKGVHNYEPVPEMERQPEQAAFSPYSAAWVFVVEYIERRIADLDTENRNLNLSEKATTEKRARIAELEYLQDLPERIKAGHELT